MSLVQALYVFYSLPDNLVGIAIIPRNHSSNSRVSPSLVHGSQSPLILILRDVAEVCVVVRDQLVLHLGVRNTTYRAESQPFSQLHVTAICSLIYVAAAVIAFYTDCDASQIDFGKLTLTLLIKASYIMIDSRPWLLLK